MMYDDKEFLLPEAEYRGAPFWSWNCHVTKKLIEQQIPVFKKMGMGGVTAHPRIGLDLPYMGPEFIERIKDTCRIAKEQGMKVILYDEDNFPSGNAGGLVTVNPRFRSRYYRLSRKKYELCSPQKDQTGFTKGFCPDRNSYEECLARGLEPEGYVLCSYRITLENGYLKSHEITEYSEIENDSEKYQVWNLYLCVDPWKEDAIPYVDTLNPAAIREFINITHEQYKKAVGEEFGKTVKAIFTDEPRIHNRNILPYPEYDKDTTLAGTDDFSEQFREKYGISLLEVIPEIVWENEAGNVYYRWAYNEFLSKRFCECYSDQIGDWCEKNGIAFTGHLLSERTLFQQTYRLGEAMRQYRSYQIPGIDILCGDLEYSTAKQAVSVARQYSREEVISELYGVTNWDYRFSDYKLQGDWQAALGVTLRVHHLSYMSMAGEGKRDWPGSIFYQSPWWEKYHIIEDHFARLNSVLRRGRAKVSVGVIHPIESYWLFFGNQLQTSDIRNEIDQTYEDMISWLLYGMIDFDFLCEALLAEGVKSEEESRGHVSVYLREKDKKAVLSVGNMEYEAVVVPLGYTMRRSTLELLEKFKSIGGTVIFAGHIAQLVDAKPDCRVNDLAGKCIQIPMNRYSLLKELEPWREAAVVTASGMLSEGMMMQLREDGEDEWLFICHVYDKQLPADRKDECIVKIKGLFDPVIYDTVSGKIMPAAAQQRKGWTYLRHDFYAHDSLLLRLKKGKPQINAAAAFEGEYSIVPGWLVEMNVGIPLKKIDKAVMWEPNVLLLDKPEYRYDDRQWNAERYCLDIEREYKKMLGISLTQPYRQRGAGNQGYISLRYEIESHTDKTECADENNDRIVLKSVRENKIYADGSIQLAVELQPGMQIHFNGKAVNIIETGFFTDSFIKTIALPELIKGTNVLEISYPFGAKSMIEPCYILGNFSVELAGAKTVIKARKRKLEYGDITRQGFPFYTGNITYVSSFALDEDSEWSLDMVHFAGAIAEAVLDNKKAVDIAFAPYRQSLGVVEEGGHEIAITLCSSRYNCFAPLHNSDKKYKWYGPESFRTKGSQWTDEYLVKPAGILDIPRLRSKKPRPY